MWEDPWGAARGCLKQLPTARLTSPLSRYLSMCWSWLLSLAALPAPRLALEARCVCGSATAWEAPRQQVQRQTADSVRNNIKRTMYNVSINWFGLSRSLVQWNYWQVLEAVIQPMLLHMKHFYLPLPAVLNLNVFKAIRPPSPLASGKHHLTQQLTEG